MWRVSSAARFSSKYFFTSQVPLLKTRTLSSANTIVVNCSNDSESKCPTTDTWLKRVLLDGLKLQQGSLLRLTSELQPTASVLVKLKKSGKHRSHSGPVIDREGYSVSSSLRAFVEACDVIGDVSLGVKSFKHIHSAIRKHRKGFSLDISLYHVLFRCLSRRGHIQVRRVKPNLSTLSSALLSTPYASRRLSRPL